MYGVGEVRFRCRWGRGTAIKGWISVRGVEGLVLIVLKRPARQRYL